MEYSLRSYTLNRKEKINEQIIYTKRLEVSSLTDDYSAVDVVFKNYKSSNPGKMIRCKKGGDALDIQNAGDGANSRWRYFVAKSDNTGVQFYDGYYGSVVNNAYTIPYQIYGIKLGTGYRQNELLITDPELESLASSLGLSDDRLYDVLNALVGRFRGCDKDRVESLGAVSSVTPTRDGWLSVQAQTNSGATVPSAVDIKLDGLTVERSYGLAIENESMYTGIPVKKGQTYTIVVYRARITNVKLYY